MFSFPGLFAIAPISSSSAFRFLLVAICMMMVLPLGPFAFTHLDNVEIVRGPLSLRSKSGSIAFLFGAPLLLPCLLYVLAARASRKAIWHAMHVIVPVASRLLVAVDMFGICHLTPAPSCVRFWTVGTVAACEQSPGVAAWVSTATARGCTTV